LIVVLIDTYWNLYFILKNIEVGKKDQKVKYDIKHDD